MRLRENGAKLLINVENVTRTACATATFIDQGYAKIMPSRLQINLLCNAARIFQHIMLVQAYIGWQPPTVKLRTRRPKVTSNVADR